MSGYYILWDDGDQQHTEVFLTKKAGRTRFRELIRPGDMGQIGVFSALLVDNTTGDLIEDFSQD
jgi:hypothetical protein